MGPEETIIWVVRVGYARAFDVINEFFIDNGWRNVGGRQLRLKLNKTKHGSVED